MTDSTGELIKSIRACNQMQIYTVNETWCIQLFDPDICANDEIDCVYETSSENLIDALKDAHSWLNPDEEIT